MKTMKRSSSQLLITVALVAFGLNACNSSSSVTRNPRAGTAVNGKVQPAPGPGGAAPSGTPGDTPPVASEPDLSGSGDPGDTGGTGDPVRITSVNGTYDSAHARVVTVHPGDVVTLTADAFPKDSNKPAGLPVEAFTWTTDTGETCRPGKSDDCLKNSHFQLNDYGVSYYVPSDMPGEVHITVRGSQSRGTADEEGGVEDSIVLRNMDETGVAAGKHELVTDPEKFAGTTFNPSQALAGMGHWVSIENVRYFVPTTYVSQGETEWAPYRHGYWAWDNVRGPTWVSYDPWGWMTDHYGVWRRHGVYGWMWMPFPDHRYHPHTVTWFDHGDHVGWYPYFQGFPNAYRHAAAQGFVDGYWLGLQVGMNIGQPDYRFLPGFTVVPRAEVTSVNLISVIVNAHTVIINETVVGIVQPAFAQQRLFMFPGGPELLASRAFLEFRGPLPLATVATVRGLRGVEFMRISVPNRPIPLESQFLARLPHGVGPIPLGAMVGPSGRLILPSTNGRGFVPAPVIFDHGRVVGVMSPLARTRAIAEAHNPIVHERRFLAEAHPLPPHELPAFDPHAQRPGVLMEHHLGNGPAAPAPHGGGEGSRPPQTGGPTASSHGPQGNPGRETRPQSRPPEQRPSPQQRPPEQRPQPQQRPVEQRPQAQPSQRPAPPASAPNPGAGTRPQTPVTAPPGTRRPDVPTSQGNARPSGERTAPAAPERDRAPRPVTGAPSTPASQRRPSDRSTSEFRSGEPRGGFAPGAEGRGGRTMERGR